jgi:two-component system, NarL family, nitrate/nitrite response regulator NarL
MSVTTVSPITSQEANLLLRTLTQRLQILLAEGKISTEVEESKEEVLLEMTVGESQYCLMRSKKASLLGTTTMPRSLKREPLSPREHEIARMIAQGHPNKTIARTLDISVWTVNTYLRRIFAKLDVTSRAAMIAQLYGNQPLLASE